MVYIYLYSAANEADVREFTSPLILFMVTYEDDNYYYEVAWGLFSLASGRGERDPLRGLLAPVTSQWHEMFDDVTQIVRYVLPCRES